MTKSEFLNRLRAALSGRVSPEVVAENINYYEDYIDTKVRNGLSEAEVLASLGDPRLLARTIAETNGGAKTGMYQSAEEGGSYREYGQQRQSHRQGQWYERSVDQDIYGQGGEEKKDRFFHIPGWLFALAAILIGVFVISIFFSILSFLLPILLPIFVVIFFVKLFRDWLN